MDDAVELVPQESSMANGVEVAEEEEESEVSPVATILAEPVSSVAVSRLKEHALRSVRRADQLRHELVQRSGTELAQAQTRSSRMEDIAQSMVLAQQRYLECIEAQGAGVGEVAALAELHSSSEQSIAEMQDVFAEDAALAAANESSGESRWRQNQERVRRDMASRHRHAAKHAPLDRRAKNGSKSGRLGEAQHALEQAQSLAEERGKEVKRLQRALQKSRSEAAQLATELESTLEQDVSKLEDARKQIQGQRQALADEKLAKQLQTAQAMLAAEQMLHEATQRESHERLLESAQQIERLRKGLGVADVDGEDEPAALRAQLEASKRRCAELEARGDGGAASGRGGLVHPADEERLRNDVEMLRRRERESMEKRTTLEAEVNRLELELELARISSSTTSSGQEATHLRKVIVRLEAEHAAQEQSHAQDMASASHQLSEQRGEVESLERRLAAAEQVTDSEAAKVVALRADAEEQALRCGELRATVQAQRTGYLRVNRSLRAARLQAFARQCMGRVREGGWLSKYASSTMKVKRVHVHVQGGVLHWGKKERQTGQSSVPLSAVRQVKFGHTDAQLKHVQHNLGLKEKRRRPVHAAWHCITLFIEGGKQVSFSGPMNDSAAAAAEAAGRGDGGCQDIMVWYAGLCAYAVHSQSPEGPEGHDFAPVGRLVVPTEGALLWARCRMRVDQLAQERASTRLGLVVAALRDAANEEPVDEFPSPPGAGGGGASAAT